MDRERADECRRWCGLHRALSAAHARELAHDVRPSQLRVVPSGKSRRLLPPPLLLPPSQLLLRPSLRTSQCRVSRCRLRWFCVVSPSRDSQPCGSFLFSGSEDGSFWRWPLAERPNAGTEEGGKPNAGKPNAGTEEGGTLPVVGTEVGRSIAPIVCVCTAVSGGAMVTGGGVAEDDSENDDGAGGAVVDPVHVWASSSPSASSPRSRSPGSAGRRQRLSLSPRRPSPLAGAASPPAARQWSSMFATPKR